MKPTTATDGSKYCQQYVLTYPGWDTGHKDENGNSIYVREPIAANEYACRLANETCTHVIQLDDHNWLRSPSDFS